MSGTGRRAGGRGTSGVPTGSRVADRSAAACVGRGRRASAGDSAGSARLPLAGPVRRLQPRRAAVGPGAHRRGDPDLPWTFGNTTVHDSIFDALIDTADEAPQYGSAKPSTVSNRIAEHIVDLLPRNPTLQIGIGSIPEAVVNALADADLGEVRFTGMATDEMVELFERGVIPADGDVPAILSPELMGTQRLMRFADHNPALAVYPSSRAHNAAVLGRTPRLVSINTAIEVDVSGQVNSEVLRGRQISGVGGPTSSTPQADQPEVCV